MKAHYTPSPWSINDWPQKDANIRIGAIGTPLIAAVEIRDVSQNEQLANAFLISAAPELLAYAECEEAKRISLLPSDKGGTGNSQSYYDTFTKHGWNGRDVYAFLDQLRRTALTKALEGK